MPPPAADWALFLDIDGTLLEIAPQPDSVVVPPDLPDLLRRLHDRLDGALAVVSGRAIADIDRLLAPAVLPAGGQHGLERRTADGHRIALPIDRAGLDEITAVLGDFAGDHPGLRLEPKGMAVALHYRHAPELEPAARDLLDRLMARHGSAFHVQPGKMVFEVKPRGATKGTVVETFLGEAPFAGRVPVFVGDDLTDEDGFRAANLFGGLSLQVGDRTPTDARYRIGSVPDLHRWLADGVTRLGERRGRPPGNSG